MERLKIFVTGAVGSGKSTLARRIAAEFAIPAIELDEVVYIRTPEGDIKSTEDARDRLLAERTASGSWVAEDAGRRYFKHLWMEADLLILLDVPKGRRNFQIVTRWIKQMLHLEKCGYKPDLSWLPLMMKWSRDYDRDYEGFVAELSACPGYLRVKSANAAMEAVRRLAQARADV